MGFTVVGPDRFLGSGPARCRRVPTGQARQAGPHRVDRRRRLLGQPLAVRRSRLPCSRLPQGTTYGWDAGTGRGFASTDSVTWETRSTLKLSGFAVDPARVDSLVAAGAEGTIASAAGGRTWQPISGAPRLVALSWAPGGDLWGVDPTGVAHRSTDGGATWQAAGDHQTADPRRSSPPMTVWWSPPPDLRTSPPFTSPSTPVGRGNSGTGTQG